MSEIGSLITKLLVMKSCDGEVVGEIGKWKLLENVVGKWSILQQFA